MQAADNAADVLQRNLISFELGAYTESETDTASDAK